jgi:hypothetical protein
MRKKIILMVIGLSYSEELNYSGESYSYFYNHAHRLRLEKLLYLELSRSSNGFFLVLLGPGGSYTTPETAARRFQKQNGRYETVSEVKRLQIYNGIYNGYMKQPFPNGHKCPFGCNGFVTAVAAGQSQRFYSGVGIFNWYYLSLPPQILRGPVVHFELRQLIYTQHSATKESWRECQAQTRPPLGPC